MYDTKDQVAVITGASGNLGQAVVGAFQNAGAKLALIDRSTDRLQQMFPEFSNSDDHFFAEDVDLLEPEAVKATIQETINRFGRIDILVNTVGGYRAGEPTHELDLKTWDFMLDLNARTVLIAVQAVVPYMIEQHSGKVISVAARPALKGRANMSAYSVSKSAVIRLTESLSAELKKNNINVNCIIPGTIDTPQNRDAMPEAKFDRWVTPESLAEVILFLASPAAKPIHGAAIPAYGLS
jgi:NAD(P)-dependent dehydrogenase (short-subunit alcohol dehydrogenase family)